MTDTLIADTDEESEILMNEIAGFCRHRDSLVVIGALVPLLFQIIANDPDLGRAIACLDAIARLTDTTRSTLVS